MDQPLHPVRDYRQKAGLTLDQLAERIEALTGSRPSKAKLSRIETREQPVSDDLIAPLRAITGLSVDELRPDFVPPAEAAQ